MSKLFKPAEWGTTEKLVAAVGAGVVVGGAVYAYVKAKKASAEYGGKAANKGIEEPLNSNARDDLEELLTGTLMEMQETGILPKATEAEVYKMMEPVVKGGFLEPQTRVLIAQYCHVLFSLKMSTGESAPTGPPGAQLGRMAEPILATICSTSRERTADS